MVFFLFVSLAQTTPAQPAGGTSPSVGLLVFSPSRGGVVCIAASLRSTQLRARTVALSRCVVRDDRPANARAFAYRQRRSRSAAVTPPPLHPPVTSRVVQCALLFLRRRTRTRARGGRWAAGGDAPPHGSPGGLGEARNSSVVLYSRSPPQRRSQDGARRNPLKPTETH